MTLTGRLKAMLQPPKEDEGEYQEANDALQKGGSRANPYELQRGQRPDKFEDGMGTRGRGTPGKPGHNSTMGMNATNKSGLNASLNRSMKSNNQDLAGVNNSPSRKEADRNYGLSQHELNELKFDLTALDERYSKWAQEDDSLSGVLNVKLTKQKNQEFRDKLKAWRARKQERKIQKKRRFEQMVQLREAFEQQRALYQTGSNQGKIAAVIDEFNQFDDAYKTLCKECKVINDFLAELPDGLTSP